MAKRIKTGCVANIRSSFFNLPKDVFFVLFCLLCNKELNVAALVCAAWHASLIADSGALRTIILDLAKLEDVRIKNWWRRLCIKGDPSARRMHAVLAASSQIDSLAARGTSGQALNDVYIRYQLACPLHLGNLTRLDITGCKDLTDNCFAMLIQACPRLASVYVGGCAKLTDDALESLRTRGQTLRSLVLAGNSNFTGPAVTKVMQASPGLLHLDLSRCYLLDAENLRKLSEYCPRLRYIGLAYCSNLTDDCMRGLAGRVVDTRGCYKLSPR